MHVTILLLATSGIQVCHILLALFPGSNCFILLAGHKGFGNGLQHW